MSPCLAPLCATQSLGLGLYPFLCVPHALAVATVAPTRPEAPFTALEVAANATKWRDLPHTCHEPAPYLPGRQALPEQLAPEVLHAAALVMLGLGARVIRTEPTYGVPEACGCFWKPSKTEREYDQGRPTAYVGDPPFTGAPGIEVGHDDLPASARTLARAATKAGWGVRVVAGPTTLLIKARRARLGVLVRYERGRFGAGWLEVGGSAPVHLDSKQVGKILRSAP